ncbi:DNA alkylation repair protein [Kordiimonas pumila]|uniref:DNA alkylation repair protein n=1 Tax=Kordiimonas pumila TaxID=2161677 RepID=A0ABV7D918_9PROT|nr:DNA alkylation repair protein [Kordiimonas pumila]
MAEPFKEAMNSSVVNVIGQVIKRVYPAFSVDAFMKYATDGLGQKELKERMLHVEQALNIYLPSDLEAFNRIALAALHPSDDTSGEGMICGPDGLCGFALWPLTALVTTRGIEQPEKALPVLKEMTKRFTAEFAIRPFLLKHTDVTLNILKWWVLDPNRHVRRLVSEGSRPRLPWGQRLQAFVADPAPILPLLETLKDDPEDYVRRSVANSLNDIAKDHPDLVASIAAEWLEGASENRRKLVRHACRTLIKNGHTATLAAFGYQPVAGLTADIDIITPIVSFGEAVEFGLTLKKGRAHQDLVVDYAIHFIKANGQSAPKVFKWKNIKLDKQGQLYGHKKHAIKPITTRQYYAGHHKLEVFVNGISVGTALFELKM